MRTFTEWLTEAANHAAAAEYVVKAMNDQVGQGLLDSPLGGRVVHRLDDVLGCGGVVGGLGQPLGERSHLDLAPWLS
jgi:hypothetical protein